MVPAAAYAIPAALKAGAGIWQMLKGSEMRRSTTRPEMSLAPSTQMATNIAERLASQNNMPGYDDIINRIQSSTAQSASAASQATDSPAAAMSALARAYDAQNNNLVDLGIASAQSKINNLQNLAAQRNLQAGEERAVWDYNVNQPYQAKMAASSALTGAGMQNTMGAVQDLTGGYVAQKNIDAEREMTEKMMKEYWESLGQQYGVDGTTPVEQPTQTTDTNMLKFGFTPQSNFTNSLDKNPFKPGTFDTSIFNLTKAAQNYNPLNPLLMSAPTPIR